MPSASAGWALGPGATWHSAVLSTLFDPAECTYATDSHTSNAGAFCSPGLEFRRMLLHNHKATLSSQEFDPLTFFNLFVTSAADTGRTSYVNFQHYNEDGYMFTAPTKRVYNLAWDTTVRLDPVQLE